MLGLRAVFPLRLCVNTTETLGELQQVQYERESGGIVRMVCADAETIANMLCHFLYSWLIVKEAGFLKALPVLVLHQH